jgi:hypothetical protein
MNPHFRNLVIATAALPIAYVSSWLCGRVWSYLFLEDRSFSVSFGFLSAYDFLNWAFYILFFCVFWAVVSCLIRTAHPYRWASLFGLSVFLLYELMTTHIVIVSSTAGDLFFLFQRASLALAIAIGCMAGAYMSLRIRKQAPNYSLKRTNQSLRD